MSEEPVFEYDESVIGIEEEVGTITVEAETVSRYCELMGETNPLYTEQGFVPPSYLQRMRFRGGPDPKVKFGNTGFHAGSRMELLKPVKVGQTLTGWAQAKEVYAKTGRSGTMVFQVSRLTYRDEDGEPVAHSDQLMVRRQIGE